MTPAEQPRGTRGRYTKTDVAVRMWGKISIPFDYDPEIGNCWKWVGGFFKGTGYGKFYVDRYPHYAHRWVYEFLVGPIPEGLEIDHLCRNRWCVNPRHLEPVTHQVNVLRGDAPKVCGEHNRRKTHCRNGHEYSGDNLYTYPAGGRGCRTCNREAQRLYAARRKEKADGREGV
jgi:hypothetical protein